MGSVEKNKQVVGLLKRATSTTADPMITLGPCFFGKRLGITRSRSYRAVLAPRYRRRAHGRPPSIFPQQMRTTCPRTFGVVQNYLQGVPLIIPYVLCAPRPPRRIRKFPYRCPKLLFSNLQFREIFWRFFDSSGGAGGPQKNGII